MTKFYLYKAIIRHPEHVPILYIWGVCVCVCTHGIKKVSICGSTSLSMNLYLLSELILVLLLQDYGM